MSSQNVKNGVIVMIKIMTILIHDHQDHHHHDNEGEKTIANLCIKVGRGCGQSDNTLAQMLPTDGVMMMMMMMSS